MIKHIVMWNVRGDTPAQRREAALTLKAHFEGLVGVIPGMRHLEVGLDQSGVDYSCDVVLYTEFEDQGSLDAYAAHPEHLRVRRELGNMRTARHQVDYAVESPTAFSPDRGERPHPNHDEYGHDQEETR